MPPGTLWLVLLALFLLASAFKGYVVWQIARDRDGGGGAPTADFFLVWPVLVAVSGSAAADAYGYRPFMGFGFVLYFGVLAVYAGVYRLLSGKGHG